MKLELTIGGILVLLAIIFVLVIILRPSKTTTTDNVPAAESETKADDVRNSDVAPAGDDQQQQPSGHRADAAAADDADDNDQQPSSTQPSSPSGANMSVEDEEEDTGSAHDAQQHNSVEVIVPNTQHDNDDESVQNALVSGGMGWREDDDDDEITTTQSQQPMYELNDAGAYADEQSYQVERILREREQQNKQSLQRFHRAMQRRYASDTGAATLACAPTDPVSGCPSGDENSTQMTDYNNRTVLEQTLGAVEQLPDLDDTTISSQQVDDAIETAYRKIVVNAPTTASGVSGSACDGDGVPVSTQDSFDNLPVVRGLLRSHREFADNMQQFTPDQAEKGHRIIEHLKQVAAKNPNPATRRARDNAIRKFAPIIEHFDTLALEQQRKKRQQRVVKRVTFREKQVVKEQLKQSKHKKMHPDRTPAIPIG